MPGQNEASYENRSPQDTRPALKEVDNEAAARRLVPQLFCIYTHDVKGQSRRELPKQEAGSAFMAYIFRQARFKIKRTCFARPRLPFKEN
jgi:hypothetical protein